jgi:predicted amidohydrolase
MKIAIAQIRYNWSDPLIKNLRKAIGLIEKSGRSGAEILCFSEYFLGKDAVLGHPSRGEKTDAALGSIAEKAKESDVAVICGATRDSRQGQRKHFVTSPVINRKGEIVKKIDKVALYPREMDWAQPGSGAETAEIDGFNIGVLAGFDIFFSPSIQALRKKGVDLLFYQLAANSRPLLETEQAAAMARCQELMAPVIVVGQLGESFKRKFLGGSVACVPQTTRFGLTFSAGGVKMFKRLGSDERFEIVELDLQELGQQRKKFNFYEA